MVASIATCSCGRSTCCNVDSMIRWLPWSADTSRVFLTLSAVTRPPCISGCPRGPPPKEPPPLLSSDAGLAAADAGAAAAGAPKPELVAEPPRGPKPDDEDGLL